MTSLLVVASTALVVLAFVDGVYLHLWRYRLHTRPESLAEHWLHTARGFLFAGILATLFLVPPRGFVLWLGLALVAVDLLVELWDMLSERDSRASIGGLSSFEYALHVLLTTVRVAAITLAVAAVPLDGWSLAASAMSEHPAAVRFTILQLLPGSVLLAILHVWLGGRGTRAKGNPRARVEQA